VIVQHELDVHAMDTFLLLADERLLANKVYITVQLDAEAPSALERSSRRVDVLTPVGVEAFHAEAAGGVVSGVLDVVLSPVLYDLQ